MRSRTIVASVVALLLTAVAQPRAQAAPSASTQALRIIEEGARYNIGDMARTVNTPTLALVYLDPQYRERYRNLRRNTLIEGSATYSRVRRFQVNATENVQQPSIGR